MSYSSTYMARMNSDESTVSQARPESISMRTTIPAFIAKKLNLEVGDVLSWDIDRAGTGWVAKIAKKR